MGGVGSGTGAKHLFETIGTRFGGIPPGLPKLQIPEIHLRNMVPLISPALTAAVLGAIESLLSAGVADRISRLKPDATQHRMAKASVNLFSPRVGRLPATAGR